MSEITLTRLSMALGAIVLVLCVVIIFVGSSPAVPAYIFVAVAQVFILAFNIRKYKRLTESYAN